MEKERKRLFLLEREISPYTGEDLFLGIFDNHKLAEDKKANLINKYRLKDEWKEQAYKDVDLVNDLKIIDVCDKIDEGSSFEESESVFLVCRLVEMFGQIMKELVLLSSDKSKMEKAVNERNNNIGEDECAYYKLEEVKLNN
ncbi:hypothetical protein FUAX_05180 [Fulvitalea axinellae]|uniref:Uncharacterized protein n=1 Tax=Fulvitalea axinellae TaxID=1182444 RepID=A0AAU9CH44_9BACT|nr:hypothetical protein FUAX_05180 [Fulvitalea axinellae]